MTAADGASTAAGNANLPGAGAEGAASEGGTSEPGFGEISGQEALPDMRDVLPTFDESYGDASGSSEGQSETQGVGDVAGNTAGQNGASGNPSGSSQGPDGPPGSSGSGSYGQRPAAQGTRAAGGMEGIAGADGTLTSMEQVAILDRQLEQSTSDFDALILEEQQRQREMERSRQSTTSAQPEPAGPGTSGRSPYQDDVAMGDGGGIGGGLGGASGGGAPPENPAIYKPPVDIPDGADDDVVARQLREAAMREPDPIIRERLWNEYRKYTGLEVPKA